VDKAQEALSVFGEDVMPAIRNTNQDGGMLTFGRLQPGKKIKKREPLFPRVEAKTKDTPTKISRSASGSRKKEKKMDDRIDLDYFKRMDLRVGTVQEAENVKGSKKLFKLVVDIGSEQRTVVAGIAEHYRPEDLKNIQVILVANLKPAKIMGQESNGMILAASNGEKLALLKPDKQMDPGGKVS
jgi:methionyl-tRNA synthetase